MQTVRFPATRADRKERRVYMTAWAVCMWPLVSSENIGVYVSITLRLLRGDRCITPRWDRHINPLTLHHPGLCICVQSNSSTAAQSCSHTHCRLGVV